jgi:hypothetical protein
MWRDSGEGELSREGRVELDKLMKQAGFSSIENLLEEHPFPRTGGGRARGRGRRWRKSEGGERR